MKFLDKQIFENFIEDGHFAIHSYLTFLFFKHSKLEETMRDNTLSIEIKK
ncbi:hypothetical protein [Niallia sp. 03133]